MPVQTRARARSLRTCQTDAETRLWAVLRNRALLGLKFRRQHPHPPYVLDFYCDELRIAVEVDGGQHNEAAGQTRDYVRTAALADAGIEVVRYWNHDVMERTTEVAEDLMNRLSARRGPSPGAGAPTSPEGRGKQERADG